MSTVLVYASDPLMRERVRNALGRRPRPDMEPVDFLDADTEGAVVAAVDAGLADLVILDGEAAPAGGLGVCRQLKNEVRGCPPMLVIIARRDDRWLATWSQADAVIQKPVDPAELTDAVVTLLLGSAATAATAATAAPPGPTGRSGLFG